MRGESVFATEIYVRNDKSLNGAWISANARPLRNEAGDLRGGVVVFQDITERKRAEETQRLLASDRDNMVRRLELQIKRLPMAYMMFDTELRVLEWNPAAEKTFGYAKEEMVGRVAFDLILALPIDNQVRKIIRRIWNGDMDAHNVNENRAKDGRIITCEWYNTPLMDSDGNFIGAISLARDITERKNLEEQLRQSQKMEAFGQLAGGIAHDFNNFLTAISIYNHLLVDSVGPDVPAQQLLQELKKATERSASLTRKLLAFSRKQVLTPQILCLNEVIRDTEQMFRRVIGDHVQLVTVLSPRLDNVKADPEQLERVLLNLIVNARDAMPRGGKLTIETKNVTLDDINGKDHPEVPPGQYVMLAVTDSGVGISREVKRHIFEPFFTTKDPEASSGLGLAVVHGIVKQSDGHIEVDIEPGCGACFKIYLPRVEQIAGISELPEELAPRLRGTETILLVDDDETLRKATCRLLQGFGYSVLEAGDGDEALHVSSQHQEPISLLVTDVVMPRLGGPALAERLVALRPGLKTLYLSGYSDGAVVRYDMAHKGLPLLHKPFSPMLLREKIREVLDAS
jgi:PAS domain S-box-containing protein